MVAKKGISPAQCLDMAQYQWGRVPNHEKRERVSFCGDIDEQDERMRDVECPVAAYVMLIRALSREPCISAQKSLTATVGPSQAPRLFPPPCRRPHP